MGTFENLKVVDDPMPSSAGLRPIRRHRTKISASRSMRKATASRSSPKRRRHSSLSLSKVVAPAAILSSGIFSLRKGLVFQRQIARGGLPNYLVPPHSDDT